MGRWSPGRNLGLERGAIHMWRLNKQGSVRHLERSGSQRSGSRMCLGIVEVSSWEDEIQLNRELPALSGEKWESQGGDRRRNLRK